MSGRLLLCTDLDRTLIPNGPEAESPAARPLFEALVARPEITLAYVSGRDESLVKDAIGAYRLPCPEFVIADVGSSIFSAGGLKEWQLDRAWTTEIAADWGEYDHAGVASLLADLAELRLQEPARQNLYKLSYYTPVEAGHDALAGGILKRLQSRGIRARLIWSVDTLANVGLLDVLPVRASKYHAVKALMRLHGFDCADTVFCGDSGNDLEVFASAIPSVVVANAQAAIRKRAVTEAKKAGQIAQLYVARGGFLGMNGNYSAGILEGIAHYQPQTLDWMSALITRHQADTTEGA